MASFNKALRSVLAVIFLEPLRGCATSGRRESRWISTALSLHTGSLPIVSFIDCSLGLPSLLGPLVVDLTDIPGLSFFLARLVVDMIFILGLLSLSGPLVVDLIYILGLPSVSRSLVVCLCYNSCWCVAIQCHLSEAKPEAEMVLNHLCCAWKVEVSGLTLSS